MPGLNHTFQLLGLWDHRMLLRLTMKTGSLDSENSPMLHRESGCPRTSLISMLLTPTLRFTTSIMLEDIAWGATNEPHHAFEWLIERRNPQLASSEAGAAVGTRSIHKVGHRLELYLEPAMNSICTSPRSFHSDNSTSPLQTSAPYGTSYSGQCTRDWLKDCSAT